MHVSLNTRIDQCLNCAICVTVPVALVVLLCIFKYKGDDFDVIMGEKRLDENGEYIEKRRKND